MPETAEKGIAAPGSFFWLSACQKLQEADEALSAWHPSHQTSEALAQVVQS